jgi:hypothetical protein
VTNCGPSASYQLSSAILRRDRRHKGGDMGYEFECDKVIPGCEAPLNGETFDETLGKAAIVLSSA